MSVKILKTLLVAALVYILIKLIRMGLKKLAHYYPDIRLRYNYLFAFEFTAWLLFTFWSIRYLFRDMFYYNYLFYATLSITLGFLAWFLFRDLFAGFIFKVKHNLKTGSHIRVGEISGYIKSMHLTYLRIRSGEGQVYRIPYSRLNSEIISEVTSSETIEESTLKLIVDPAVKKTDCEPLILSAILCSPWTNLKEEPTIKFMEMTPEGYLFEVRLYSLNRNHTKLIEMALEEIPHIHVRQ